MATNKLDSLSAPGFTLIELMITVAIIGILAVIAIPAYRTQLAVSNGGSSMQSLTGFVISAQVCIQSDKGCDALNSKIMAIPELSETRNGGSVSTGMTAKLVYDNGTCATAGLVGDDGTLTYSAVASAGSLSASDADCKKGAGLL